MKTKWIFKNDTGNPVDLPRKWKDNNTGISYSNLNLYDEGKLNSLGWYKCFINDVSSNNWYETIVNDDPIFENNQYTIDQRIENIDSEKIKLFKKNELIRTRREYLENTLDNVDDTIKWINVYKVIGKLISYLNSALPAVKNDEYLQTILSKLVNLSNQLNEIDNKIEQIDNSVLTDQEIINL